MERYSKNLRPCLSELKPYVAGKGIQEIAKKYGFSPEEIVKLGSNENPYGPSPEVISAVSDVPFNIYPEPLEFIESAARYTGFEPSEILVGCGLDGVMDTLGRIFMDKGDFAIIPTPTFLFYELLTRLCGGRPIFMRRGPGFDLPGIMPDNSKMIFLCSPNNPTGNSILEDRLREIVESTSAIVFVDEAYVEFADRSLIGLVREYENLIVGRTLSKAFGLAGLRIGYAVSPEWISKEYWRASPPFTVTNVSLAAGCAALGDQDFMKRSVSKIRSERDRLKSCIPEAYPSDGNFLYIKTPEKSSKIAEELLKRGIIVRDCTSFRDSGEFHIRVTVGTPEQNRKFIEAYQEICL